MQTHLPSGNILHEVHRANCPTEPPDGELPEIESRSGSASPSSPTTEITRKEVVTWKEAGDLNKEEEALEEDARLEVMERAAELTPKEQRTPTIDVLHDGVIGLFPDAPRQVVLHQRPEVSLLEWAIAIQQKEVMIQTHRVVVFLKLHKYYFTPSFLSQGIKTLVAAIRRARTGVWIYFISPEGGPDDSENARKTWLKYPTLLRKALDLIGIKASNQRLIFLPVTECMMIQNRQTRPSNQLKDEQGKYTKTGCFLWAHHLLTEIGARPYPKMEGDLE
jgi:hypothetical protein